MAAAAALERVVQAKSVCCPQGDDRTPLMRAALKVMLDEVNLLYLGCMVLILMERSYLSRFWTQFEAWLAFQTATSRGLVSSAPHERRVHIEVLFGASGHLANSLIEEWADCTADKAYDILNNPDVSVTKCAHVHPRLQERLNSHMRSSHRTVRAVRRV